MSPFPEIIELTDPKGNLRQGQLIKVENDLGLYYFHGGFDADSFELWLDEATANDTSLYK